MIGAGLGLSAAALLQDVARPSVAQAATAAVWSVRTVAIIGADEILACGRDNLIADAKSLGFAAADVYVDAVAGRTLAGRDRTGRSVADVLSAACGYFGGEPDVWVIHLGTSGSDADMTAQVTAALAGMANDTDRKICWLSQLRSSLLGTTALRFNAVAAPLVNAMRNSWYQDLDGFLFGHLDSSPWAPVDQTLTASGLSLIRRFIRYSVLPATTGADGGWTTSRLLNTPGRPGPSIQDPASGYTWTTVRYEDLYRSGDSFQQALNRCSGGQVVTLPEGEFLLDDFSNGYHDAVRIGSSGASGCRGIAGSGRGTVIRLRGSAGQYTDANSGNLIGIDLRGAGPAYLGNFQLRGVDMAAAGSSGIFLANSPGSVLEWLYLNGASKGYANYPPGETFGINVYLSDRVVIRDTEVDGRDPVTRQRRGASPIGWNGSWSRYAQDARVQRTYTHHSIAGMTTFWLTNNVTLDNFHSFSCGSGSGRLSGSQVNLEEVTGRVRMAYPRLYTHGRYYRQTQWSADPTATDNTDFAFAQACTTSDQRDVVVTEPRFDLGVNGLLTTSSYAGYTSSSGALNKVSTPPTIVKNGVQLTAHAHNTSGWQQAATVDTDFTWVR